MTADSKGDMSLADRINWSRLKD